MPQKTRFTIYDAMEQGGVFASNPANPGARDNDGNPLYTGPVEYPKMLYHPEGEEKVVIPAEIVMTPLGPRENNEQKELIYKVVNTPEEEAEFRALGWFAHPAEAVKVRIEAFIAGANLSEKEQKALLAKIPKIRMSENREAALLAEIEKLKRERDAANSVKPRDALVAEPDDGDEEAA